MKDKEFLASSNVYGTQIFGVSQAQLARYVLDPLSSLVMQHQQAEPAAQLLFVQDTATKGLEGDTLDSAGPLASSDTNAMRTQPLTTKSAAGPSSSLQDTAGSKGLTSNIEVKVVSTGLKLPT